MTLNLDLETCFKIIARLLLKGTLWSKYEPDRIKRKYMLRKSDLGRTDYCMATAERVPNEATNLVTTSQSVHSA